VAGLRHVGASAATAARGIGGAVLGTGRGVASAAAMLWAWARSIATSVGTTGRRVGWALGRGVSSASAMLWAGTRDGAVALVAALRRGGRGTRPSLPRLAPAAAGRGAAVRATARRVAAVSRASARGIARVAQRAPSMPGTIPEWSPGAVFAVLSLLVFTL